MIRQPNRFLSAIGRRPLASMLVLVSIPLAGVVRFDALAGESFLQSSRDVPDLDLRIYHYVPASRYWENVAQFTGMFSLAALVVFLAALRITEARSGSCKPARICS